VLERREYVLPARFDDTPLPRLLPDVSYVDLRAKNPAAVRRHDRRQAGRPWHHGVDILS